MNETTSGIVLGTVSSDQHEETILDALEAMGTAIFDGNNEIVLFGESEEGEESHQRVNAYVFFGVLSTVGAVVGNLIDLCVLSCMFLIRRLCCRSKSKEDTFPVVVDASADLSVDSDFRREEEEEDDMREDGKRVQTYLS